MYTHTYTFRCIYMCTYMHIYMFICICTYISIYIYPHTCNIKIYTCIYIIYLYRASGGCQQGGDSRAFLQIRRDRAGVYVCVYARERERECIYVYCLCVCLCVFFWMCLCIVFVCVCVCECLCTCVCACVCMCDTTHSCVQVVFSQYRVANMHRMLQVAGLFPQKSH